MKYFFSILFVMVVFFFIPRSSAVFAIPLNDNSSVFLNDPGIGGGVKKPAEQGKINDIQNTKESLEKIFDTTANFDRGKTPDSGDTPNVLPSLSPIPSQSPGGIPIDQSFAALEQLYAYVGGKIGVPACVIEAISHIEFGAPWDYTAEEINRYSQPGNVIPNCPLNSCSASGHMQMTTGIDDKGSSVCNRCGSGLTHCPNAWGGYKNTVKDYESGNYEPNVCNLRDATYAATKMMKSTSKSTSGYNWGWVEYERVGIAYLGSCKIKLGGKYNNRTYCEQIAYYCSL